MLFKILAAVLLVATSVRCDEKNTVYAKISWKYPLGECVQADCYKVNQRPGINNVCDRRYTVNGERKHDTLYMNTVGDRTEITDENGVPTGKTMTFETKGDLIKFTRNDEKGVPEEICCASKKLKLNPKETDELDKLCDMPGRQYNINKNCPKRGE